LGERGLIRNREHFESSLPAGFDGVFEWDFLNGAWGQTKIQPMDIDGMVERFGHFLVFETKKNETVPIPVGQRITLEALVRTKLFVVIVLYGKTADTINTFEIWRMVNGVVDKKTHLGNSNDVWQWANKWFRWASRKKAA